jgi:hypothetical protein
VLLTMKLNTSIPHLVITINEGLQQNQTKPASGETQLFSKSYL